MSIIREKDKWLYFEVQWDTSRLQRGANKILQGSERERWVENDNRWDRGGKAKFKKNAVVVEKDFRLMYG